MEKIIQIAQSELLDDDGYTLTITALTDKGRIFILSDALIKNALENNTWKEVLPPGELNK